MGSMRESYGKNISRGAGARDQNFRLRRLASLIASAYALLGRLHVEIVRRRITPRRSPDPSRTCRRDCTAPARLPSPPRTEKASRLRPHPSHALAIGVHCAEAVEREKISLIGRALKPRRGLAFIPRRPFSRRTRGRASPANRTLPRSAALRYQSSACLRSCGTPRPFSYMVAS